MKKFDDEIFLSKILIKLNLYRQPFGYRYEFLEGELNFVVWAMPGIKKTKSLYLPFIVSFKKINHSLFLTKSSENF
jgi:hypothetical protein